MEAILFIIFVMKLKLQGWGNVPTAQMLTNHFSVFAWHQEKAILHLTESYWGQNSVIFFLQISLQELSVERDFYFYS